MADQLKKPFQRKHRGRWFALVAVFALGIGLGLLPAAGASTSQTFAPVADATVYSNSVSTNYGGENYLRTDRVPPRRAFLRFDLSGLGGTVSRATLRLYSVGSHNSGFQLHAAPTDWDERTLNWGNAPQPGEILGRSGAFSASQWLSFDVTTHVKASGAGPVGFAMTSESSSSMSVWSREGPAAARPQLIVETDGSSSSSSSTTTTSSTMPMPTSTSTSTATTTASTTTTSHEMPMPAAPADPRLTCEGYGQKRLFLESQGWWTRAPGLNGTDFGHVHSGTCFPWRQDLSGIVHFDVRLMMHKNPGVLTRLRIQMFHSGAPDPVKLINLNYRCAVETCTWWVPVDIDTRQSYDGCQEFRFQAWVKEPDGKELIATTGWRANIKNGRPVQTYCDAARGVNFTEGRGWYTGTGYENGRVDDPLPMAPVSGIWSPKLKAAPGSEGIAATYHLVTIDPNFHMGDRGRVLKEGPGQWGPARLAIDTTKLSNGPHRLVIRTDANTGDGSVLSGLLVVSFTVQN